VRRVHDAVEDCVGQRRIVQPLVPRCDWQLARDQRGARAHPIVEQLKQIVALGRADRRDREVVDGQQIDARELREPPSEAAIAMLWGLRRVGVRLSVDDFGTGYSSLAYLKRLPIDEVKLDKSFVLNMTGDSNDAAIVRSTIDLAHNLGLQLVAEGVEDQETLELLAALGCDLVQGYHLARPMPADDLVHLQRTTSSYEARRPA